MQKKNSAKTADASKGALAIVYRPIGELRPDPENPRNHSSKQLRQIGRSIEAFGFNVPVLVDADGKILAGHGRVLACEKLGWKTVPTISIDHLSATQKRAFMIADNRLQENSSWNNELLAQHLKILSDVELDFDLELTGFDTGEIDIRLGDNEAKPDAETDPADDVLPVNSKKAVSRSGDLWILGNHRVFCGNALNPTSYQTLMQGKTAHVVFTDPPYNVAIEGHVSAKGTKHREFAMAAGEMTSEEFTTFLSNSLSLVSQNSTKSAIHFVCMDWRHAGDLLAATAPIYSELKNICVWVKDAAGMGSLYRSKHELVFVLKNGKTPHKNNIRLGVHGRNRSNVWTYPGFTGFAKGTDEGKLTDLHPTVKPVALIADALLDCSSRGDIVLDCFLGSGSTLIAAQRTGRQCFGIEIDPVYVDTVIRRFQAFTGQHALHAVSGRTFNDLESKKGAK